MFRDEDVRRFWEKVDAGQPGECWEWIACKQGGYGRFKWRGKTRQAHRVSWEIAHGPIPPGMVLLHSCDNHSCVNPCHLSLGTQYDNIEDMLDKGRQINGPNQGDGRKVGFQGTVL